MTSESTNEPTIGDVAKAIASLAVSVNSLGAAVAKTVYVEPVQAVQPVQVDVREIARHLEQAQRYLAQALRENDLKWTRATDSQIEYARAELNRILTILPAVR